MLILSDFRITNIGTMPEVFPRNTRHERFQQSRASVVAVYCYALALRSYLRQEPLTYFSEAGPCYGNLRFWAAFWSRILNLAKLSGCRDRPYRNFTTAVDEGKTRGHVCSKTQLHVLF